jgi:hypothetical protein
MEFILNSFEIPDYSVPASHNEDCGTDVIQKMSWFIISRLYSRDSQNHTQ